MSDFELLEKYVADLREALNEGNIRHIRFALEGILYKAECLKTDLELRPRIVKSIYKGTL